ncbi:winged helix-turn-helix domain-containing protein [Cereibacter sphaeroides]|uniref:Winged helix-turn-helix domain-containing protein n=1 Tax=Cereibacter sphaeroides TaxID=1063 RepID=A0AAX1UMX9_CERSP|nr:winged helix-turn-helix domain-containing protein [Cereibacter sphaeroides]RHZ96479.1 winged helix-turn-helix domain-containing protein [Cereibacter sphaeroides]
MKAHRGKIVSNAEFRRLWLDNTISAKEIGQRLDISLSAVSWRARSRGLPPRKKGLAMRAHRRITAEALRPLWVCGVNLAGLAEHFGVKEEAITKAARRLGMPPRSVTRWNSITLEQYRAQQLADRMAEEARKTRLQMQFAEMVDGKDGRADRMGRAA